MQAKLNRKKVGDSPGSQHGQGLVEYALILVLVAVVVIVILTMLGPSIGNVFSKATGAMNTDIQAKAERTGGGHGNGVTVQVSVKGTMDITLTHQGTGTSHSMTCVNTCSYTFSGVGNASGSITVSGLGGFVTAAYPAKT